MLLDFRLRVIILATLIVTSVISAQPQATMRGKKVCVAGIANSSAMPVSADQIKERLVRELQEAKVNAVSAPTLTLLANRLDLSAMNSKAFQATACDYMLLTEIAKPKSQESTMLVVKFALFQKGKKTSVLNDSVPADQGTSPTEAIMSAMDQLSSRVKLLIAR